MAPKKVAALHWPEHQKGRTPGALGNRRADREACAAALRAPHAQPVAVTAALLPAPLTEWVPHRSINECERFTKGK
jgi:hypothetical protein